jgi:hypothetical protein
MGCGKKDGRNNECVCDAVKAIKDAQDAVDDCPSSCFNNLLSPIGKKGDTIPFILKCCDGTPFYALGNVGKDSCFPSIWFRVEDIHDCCATLRILRPLGVDDKPLCAGQLAGDGCCVTIDGQCKMQKLKKTDDCIEVDLSCFCGIQCLDPKLVKR